MIDSTRKLVIFYTILTGKHLWNKTATGSSGEIREASVREGQIGYLERGKEGVNISELVVDHKSEQTHLSGTSLVQFNSTLVHLGFGIKRVPAEVNEAVTEVTNEFVLASGILHESKLKGTNEGNSLGNTGTWDGGKGSETRSTVREGSSRKVNITWEVDASLVNKESNNTKHTDTSVLDFDVSETVELFLVTIGNKAKGIEETKRSLGTEFVLESFEGGGGSFLGGRSESSGGGKEGGENGGLHLDKFLID